MFADHDHADCRIEITGRSFIFFKYWRKEGSRKFKEFCFYWLVIFFIYHIHTPSLKFGSQCYVLTLLKLNFNHIY